MKSIPFFCKNEEMGELHDLLARWETGKKAVFEWNKVEEKKADKIYVIESVRHSIWICFFEPSDIIKVVPRCIVDTCQWLECE